MVLSISFVLTVALLYFIVARNEDIPQNIFLNYNDLATANRIEYTDSIRGTHIVMVRDKNNWMVSQPFTWEANRFSIEGLFDCLGQLRMKKINLKQHPTRKLLIKTKRRDYVIALANNTLAFLDEVYTSDDIDKINKILNRPASYWCQRELFSDNQASIDSIIFDISGPNQKYVLTKHSDLWKFEAPISINANTKLVDRVLADIIKIEAEQFFSEQTCNMDEIGLATPECSLLIQYRDSQTTLDIGKWFPPSENLFFARIHNKGTVMTVKIENMAQIRDPLNSLYDRKIVDMANISSIGISQGATKWFLQKSDSNETWKLVNKDKKTEEWITSQANNDKIHALLSLIYNLKSNGLQFGQKIDPQDESSTIKLILEANDKVSYELFNIDENWMIRKNDNNFLHLIDSTLPAILTSLCVSDQLELLNSDRVDLHE